MSEAQLYWAWDRKQPYNQDGSKRYVEMVDAADYEALRDEVVRLKEQLKNAQADTWEQAARSHSDKDGNPCEYCLCQVAALTPQAGKGGGE